MALDKQKILNELGNVMNQLKSTDCGCMNKLFGNSGQNITSPENSGGYRQGCCHGHHCGFSPKSCGEIYPNNTQNYYRPCMGQCNPPKLYADTYNYLTENLMQPTINEVYNDLKSITPANTVMNNPMANQMGLSTEKKSAQYISGSTPSHFQMEKRHMENLNFPHRNIPTNNPNSNSMGHMGGMGPQIMNMFGERDASKLGNMAQQVKPISWSTNNQNDYNQNVVSFVEPTHTNEPMKQSNMQPAGNSQHISSMNSSAALSHQGTANNQHHHGQHAQGIAKFNEMFPGVVKNGDLGFDPMAIAIQMNPANQKQVALDTIHKIMNNNGPTLNTNVNSAGVHSGITNNQYDIHPKQIQGNVRTEENLRSNFINQQTDHQISPQQQAMGNTPLLINQQMTSQQVSSQYGQFPGQTNQNVYTAVTSTPSVMQQEPLKQPLHYQQQSVIDPSTSTVIAHSTVPTAYAVNTNPNQVALDVLKTQPIIKEPILPADTSKFVMPKQKYEYNTLGQPIETFPAKIYHTPEPPLPQTLSPETTIKPNFAKYSNVKSTISKTSLMGNRPVGKTPSRNQLQHIYNQYKGSQSYTQQNLQESINKDASHSVGRLNIAHENLTCRPQMPVENIGGDTAANNRISNEKSHRMEHIIGQIGDAPITNKSDFIPEKLSPVVNRKYRNGLQDIVYTSYPTSAAWSFHGHDRATSFDRCRYRNKI